MKKDVFLQTLMIPSLTFLTLLLDLQPPNELDHLEEETKGTVAEVFLRNHENIFITDYGYVFFDSSSC